ncbi:hypothetical protein [Clostridium sp.]|uniref:hypothetical protein n=1 Tax=Clostridium sp. TaxID=1506 RepID=UPI002850CBF3|nr:hypothetical protein [Clostridium sp.]MDR3597075.1 hypothetical protein [Clostridium sp.]
MLHMTLNLDAYYPVPPIGELMLYKGLVYKIVSSTFIPETDEDEEEIYGYQPEHLEVEVQDVTRTEEGQLLITDEATKQDKLRTIRGLKLKIKSMGTPIERVNGEFVPQPEGAVLFDSFDIYGSGERLIETGTEYWYLINNGADGDDWGRNTVRTGGAGAYGWKLSLNQLFKGGEELC